ncbi:MAG: prolyl oligopeptidase [Verrucomicrobiales bacterium]|jgi:prolyl oligopeptidase
MTNNAALDIFSAEANSLAMMMNPLRLRSLTALSTLMMSVPASAQLPSVSEPPETRRTDYSDTIHGIKVADPYRWLEGVDDPQVDAWVGEQADSAQNYLASLPGRAAIRESLEKLWDYDRQGIPRIIAGKLFYSRQTGLQNQSVVYWREDSAGAKEKVLLDPNTLTEDGTVALTAYSISDDGKLMAYGTSASGSDWQEWRVREVATGKDLSDHLRWIKFSSAQWTPDNKGLIYSRYAAPEEGEELKSENYFQKVYLHKVGTPQSDDSLVYERPDQKTWGFGCYYTDDERYQLFSVWAGSASKNAFFYHDLSAQGKVVELLKEFDAKYDFVGNDGELFYFTTTLDSPNGRVIAIPTSDPARASWKTIIPEAMETLQGVRYIGGKFIATYLVDAKDEVRLFDKSGKSLGKLPVDVSGSVSGFGGRQDATETFYHVSGFTTPGTLYRYDLGTGEAKVFYQTKLAYDPDKYTTTQEFFESKDGTRIPLFIVHRKGMVRDGSHPTLLYGYGGFDISLGPAFSPAIMGWLEAGGVYVMAILRGGGEYGEAWHNAGKRLNKQNVFDDFIGAGEYLIREKFTTSSQLGISGRSNGGLLVGACLNQRPDLFAAAIPGVGVHDMLRFHKFTIGWAWQEEYGFPDKSADEFKYLLGYSPYHNVKQGATYPPTLILTGDHDDRVFPAHSFKYGAALQHGQGGDAPIILRIDRKAGHGAGRPTSKTIDEYADIYAFLANALNMNIPGKVAPVVPVEPASLR